jgi:hypothetical protein
MAHRWESLDEFMEWIEQKVEQEVIDNGQLVKFCAATSEEAKFHRCVIALLWRMDRRLKKIEQHMRN